VPSICCPAVATERMERIEIGDDVLNDVEGT
jgi:hypothetical protein